MTLLDEMKVEPRRPLKVDLLLQELPKKEASDLRAALKDESIPANRIARVLQRHQHHIDPQSIQSWRRRHVTS